MRTIKKAVAERPPEARLRFWREVPKFLLGSWPKWSDGTECKSW